MLDFGLLDGWTRSLDSADFAAVFEQGLDFKQPLVYNASIDMILNVDNLARKPPSPVTKYVAVVMMRRAEIGMKEEEEIRPNRFRRIPQQAGNAKLSWLLCIRVASYYNWYLCIPFGGGYVVWRGERHDSIECWVQQEIALTDNDAEFAAVGISKNGCRYADVSNRSASRTRQLGRLMERIKGSAEGMRNAYAKRRLFRVGSPWWMLAFLNVVLQRRRRDDGWGTL